MQIREPLRAVADITLPSSQQGKRLVWIAWFMVCAGLVVGRLYHGSWRNLATEFSLWSPLVFGMSLLEAKLLWDSQFCHLKLRGNEWLSLAVTLGILLFNALLVG
jgi:hypothetical protein